MIGRRFTSGGGRLDPATGEFIDRKAPTACDTGIGACCAFIMVPYLGFEDVQPWSGGSG